MALYVHTLSDGMEIQIDLKRNAKKNLILRHIDAHTVSINIPPFLSGKKLQHWLLEHENLLRQILAKTPAHAMPTQLPKWIWFQGIQTALCEYEGHIVQAMPSEIWVPKKTWALQKKHLRRFFQQRAADDLLPRLQYHANALQLQPAAMALTQAKTFWGVCRQRTGIRLNWRLIGAPEYVVDYVCIHELCHLTHPNHSPRFWHMVNQHTQHTEAAKQWLKTHGNELFVLDEK